MRKALMVLAAGLALLGGCGAGDEPPSETIVGAGGEDVELNGNWASSCGTVGSDATITLRVFGGDETTKTENTYLETTSCNDSAALVSRQTGDFSLGGTVAVTLPSDESGDTLVNATKIDLTLTAATITLNDITLVNTYNSDGKFGFTDWELGKSQDVFQVAEDGSAAEETTRLMVIYADEQTDPDVLYVGTGEEVDVDGYPTALDNSRESRL